MIVSVTVERFRGLQRLEVNGFGRVNLIIGKNNCGKTALMEALNLIDDVDAAADVLREIQESRDKDSDPEDFERSWRPLFWNQDADRGFQVNARNGERDEILAEVRKVKSESTTISRRSAKSSRRAAFWAIEVLTRRGKHKQLDRIALSREGMQFPELKSDPSGTGSGWIGPSRAVGTYEVQLFSELKQAGRDTELIDILREVDARTSSLEILAPGGQAAELFVRLEPRSPLLPLSMMGDGFQRCFEIGVIAIGHEWPTLFIDEIDNGLHHSVLQPVWRWLATISAKRNIQVFATTHSEECIQAACRAFTATNDDGLRVIRLDRRDDSTVATIYDRSLVEAATEMGVEIRG